MPRPKSKSITRTNPLLSSTPVATEHLDIGALETWLWAAACTIRGATDAPKFKDFILPLVFYKRMSDVFDDEFAEQVATYGDEDVAWAVIEQDHADAMRTGRNPVVRFFVPREYRWEKLRHHAADGTLGQFVTDAMRTVAGQNAGLQGVLDVKDYNERQSGQRTMDDDRLLSLIEILSRHRLGLKNAAADILGHAYEYLLRKFAEGQGQSAGEFYTPPEVARLMAELLNPHVKATVYDPTCGSGGLLIKARAAFDAQHPDEAGKAPKLYGQELNGVTFAMAKMNLFLHDYTDSEIAIGDTFRRPHFHVAATGLTRFDYVVANPMWNQVGYGDDFYDHDRFNRFSYGFPPRSSADWGWAQHILASLKDDGRAAIVLDTGAVSRGSGSKGANKERDIRKTFVEADVVEAVVLLPENLFYNTTAPGIILLLNRHKPTERRGQFLLVNASQFFVKEKPKNALTVDGIGAISAAFRDWDTDARLSKVVTLDQVRAADYNLSPSQFVDVNSRIHHRPMAAILVDLAEARAARERADCELAVVLAKLGLNGDPEA